MTTPDSGPPRDEAPWAAPAAGSDPVTDAPGPYARDELDVPAEPVAPPVAEAVAEPLPAGLPGAAPTPPEASAVDQLRDRGRTALGVLGDLAQRRPAAFLAGAAVAGVVASRILGERRDEE